MSYTEYPGIKHFYGKTFTWLVVSFNLKIWSTSKSIFQKYKLQVISSTFINSGDRTITLDAFANFEALSLGSFY